MKKTHLFLLFSLVFALGFSQTISTVDVPNIIGPTATDNIATVSSVGLTRGSGVAQNSVLYPYFSTKNWTIGGDLATAELNDDYIEWSVTASTTFNINLDEIGIFLRRNSNGPSNWQLLYSLDGFSTSGIDASGVQSLPTSATEYNLSGLSINSGTSGTITFRLYAWGATTNGGYLRVVPKNAWSISPAIPSPGIRLVATVASGSTNSIESDIVSANFPGVPNSNIDYTNYSATMGLTFFNSTPLGAFSIRDGGASGSDSDTDGTTLTSIEFAVANSENIASLAIFDGFTNVAEVTAVTPTTTFTGLSLTADDDSTKEFLVFATFKSTVTDNEQVQLIVNTVTTPTSGSSLFTASNAGGASTSIAGDDNRIEVMASQFQFIQQPTDSNQGEIMVPYPVIHAVDANLNQDLDANVTGINVSTISGASSIVGETYDMVNGVAILDKVVFTEEEVNRNLIASSTSPSLSAISTSFSINGPLISIFEQNFDSATSWSYSSDTSFFGTVSDWGNTGYFGEIALADASPINYSAFDDVIFGENDLNDGSNPFATLTFADVDITLFADVRIDFDWQVVGYVDNANDIQYRLILNGTPGAWETVFDGNGTISDDQGRVRIQVPNGNTTVGLQVRLRNDMTTAFSGFDNFRVVSQFEGLIYTDAGGWKDNEEPNASTGAQDALIIDGTYDLSGNVQVNNLTLYPAASIDIPVSQSLTINGDMNNNGTIVLNPDSNPSSTTYSSLIVNGTANGEVIYKRHVNQFQSTPGATTGQNDLISAPVTSPSQNFLALRTANPVIPSGNIGGVFSYLFGPFDNNANTYVNYTAANDSNPVEAGVGYRTASLTTGGSPFTFVGNVITSTVTVPITNGSSSEFNLVGNPFPSYISLAGFLADNNSQFNPLSSGVYGYDGAATDGFTIWNQAFSDANPNAVITPGQGFLVSSKTGGGTITFSSSIRTTGTSDDFILGRNAVPLNAYFNLELKSDSNTYRTDLYFNENASLGMDSGYDSVIYNNETPVFSIYSHLVEDNTGINMAVQSVGYNDLDNVTIPLGVNANQGEQITFSIINSNIPEDVSVYLKDNVTNTFTNLKEGNYVLTPNTLLQGTGRFSILFSRQQLNLSETELNSLEVYTTVAPKTIVVKGQLTGDTTLHLYDIQGRLVTTKALKANSNQRIVDVTNLSSGIYVVQLQNATSTRTQKVVLK